MTLIASHWRLLLAFTALGVVSASIWRGDLVLASAAAVPVLVLEAWLLGGAYAEARAEPEPEAGAVPAPRDPEPPELPAAPEREPWWGQTMLDIPPPRARPYVPDPDSGVRD